MDGDLNFRHISCTFKPFLPPDLGSQHVSYCDLVEYSANYNGRFIMGGRYEKHTVQYVCSSVGTTSM